MQSIDYSLMNKQMLINLVIEQAEHINNLSEKLDTVTEELSVTTKELDKALLLAGQYAETIATLNFQIFGVSSEKRRKGFAGPIPDNTLNEPEALADPNAEEPTIDEVTKPRNRGEKKVGKREEDFKNYPVVEVLHDYKGEHSECEECGGNLRYIATETRDELVVIPETIFIRRHLTPAYACDCCEKENDKASIHKADTPKAVIPNSGIASPSLIAYIAFRKYFMGLPLYRQEKEFKLMNMPISRQNMSNWMIYASVRYFKDIFDIMHYDLLQSEIIHCDETPVKVLKEPNRKGKTKNSKSYFWLFRTGRAEPNPIVLYKYSPSRAHDIPEEFLKGFNNYAHVDGYEAYHLIKGINWVGCWAHVRRKFMDAYKLIPPKDRGKTPLTLCEVGLEYIDKLFSIEKEISELSYDKVFDKRNEFSLPVMDEFFTWVDMNLETVTSGSRVGIALTYASNQKMFLKKFLLDGRLELSNNRAERSIRPVAIGRKNWMFADTDNGADASTILYSLILSSVENSLDPFKYIEFVLDELSQIPQEERTEDILRNYLPYSEHILSNCKPTIPASSNTEVT